MNNNLLDPGILCCKLMPTVMDAYRSLEPLSMTSTLPGENRKVHIMKTVAVNKQTVMLELVLAQQRLFSGQRQLPLCVTQQVYSEKSSQTRGL